MGSIRSVAKLAGVSVSSVSKVLNGYPDVSDKTREIVMAAAKELNYSPNLIAKNLSQKKSNRIALILSNFEDSNSEDGLVFKIMSGVFEAAIKYKYELIVLTTNQAHQNDKSYYQLCKERMVEGIVIHGLKTTDRYFNEIVESDIASVVIDTQMIGKMTSSISIDNELAAKEAIQFLIEKGHRNIGFINGHNKAVVSKERFSGYLQGMKENNINIKSDWILECEFSEIKAYLNAENYIKKNKELTAIFCASDLMAIGLMRRFKEMGIDIPNELSILGFDDISLCRYVTPELSSVRQDFWKSGFNSVELLDDIMKNGTNGKHMNLFHKIVDRNSIRKL